MKHDRKRTRKIRASVNAKIDRELRKPKKEPVYKFYTDYKYESGFNQGGVQW